LKSFSWAYRWRVVAAIVFPVCELVGSEQGVGGKWKRKRDGHNQIHTSSRALSDDCNVFRVSPKA
jgi:hypothetical protein